nr:RNA-directed DNA polymerase, eukaryota, reverse transcriptase zinc-binding domain protein [Tanacetum cinerariifolium]
VILFSIHSDEWKSFQSQHQTALRIRRWPYNLIPVESKFKNLMLDHQDKYMMKAQDVIIRGQTCWTTIVKEARSLKGTGINVVDLIRLKLENGDSSSFWDDKWYAGGIIKDLFPRLYALELHKHATVRMKLIAPSLDNSFYGRVRSGAEESKFNSLLEIVQVINLVPCKDRYFWSLESEWDYSMASISKLIDEKRFQEASSYSALMFFALLKGSGATTCFSVLVSGKTHTMCSLLSFVVSYMGFN